MKHRRFKGKANKREFSRNVNRTHQFNLPALKPFRGGIRL